MWGWHLILDCAGCNDNVKNADALRTFVKQLVVEIDMKAFGEPTVVHFATHDPNKGGYSLVQLIETSAITGHFVDLNGDAYLDIFSCKEIPVERAVEFVKKWWDPRSVKVQFLTRQA